MKLMSRIAKWQLLLLALLLGPLLGQQAHAQTINAASCSSAAVQTALNSVTADGTTVNIPTGSCTWTADVTYNQVFATILQGQSNISGTCAPGGSCTPSDSTNITFGNGVQFTVHIAGSKTFRLTGISFTFSGNTPQYGNLTFNCGGGQIRLDHNHLNDEVSGGHTVQPDQCTGVLDHNFWDSTNQGNLFFIQPTLNDGGSETDGQSNYTWTQPENFGSSGFLFVENNFFQNGAFLFDCDFGGRVVFRYNTGSTNTRIQTHGTGSGAQRRGCRAMEIYNNAFVFSTSPNSNSFAFLVDYESGPLMFWGNTITGYVVLLRQQEVRADNVTYSQSATPAGFGYCGTDFDGKGSNWDSNSNSGTGYPCLDQVGRGAGQMLTGSLPSLINSSTGTIAWPNQALVPTYAWGNTQNSNSFAPNHFWQNEESPARVTENTDYYLQLPNTDENVAFNGTKGIGQGLAAAKPSTCSTTVGWWGTDTQTLYLCKSTNAWSASYAPYAYPHPLVTGQSAGNPPAPPTNLAASVQ